MKFIRMLLITVEFAALFGCASTTDTSQTITPAQASYTRVLEAPLEIKPTADLDENLFLLRALETTYNQWPSEKVEREQLQNWLAQTRIKISRLRATIRIKNLNSDVGYLYDDCLKFLDLYETYLANIGAINRDELRKAQVDLGKVFVHSFASSLLTGQPVVGVIDAIVKGYEYQNARETDRDNALDSEARRMKAVLTTTMSTAEVYADRLTQLYGWQPGEAGFDGDKNRKLPDNVQRRPRDPFIKAAYLRSQTDDTVSTNMMDNARKFLEAARLVPDGLAYEGFRVEFVAAAANLSVDAAIRELPQSTYSLGPAKSASEAVRICSTLLALDPQDVLGTGNIQLARALAADHRYEEALVAVHTVINKEKWRNDGGFSIRAAKLYSLTHQPELVGEWLKKSYNLGFSDIDVIRASEDFSYYRTARPEEFNKLTTVGFEWKIKYDITLHEVVLYNTSPFKLTNIRLRVTAEKDGKLTKKEVKLASLLPGQSHTFEDVLYLWSGKFDNATAKLDADQDKK